jgi:hypothetical protein
MIDSHDRATAAHEHRPAGWLRLLALLLIVWEPVGFAAAAAGAFNAVAVRGTPVVLVLAARLVATALCVAAGRALMDGRSSAPLLAKLGLSASLLVQLFAALTTYFPSNRLPGQTPLYVSALFVYYGGWLAYVFRSRRVARLSAE